jgi:hypothetical protein
MKVVGGGLPILLVDDWLPVELNLRVLLEAIESSFLNWLLYRFEEIRSIF